MHKLIIKLNNKFDSICSTFDYFDPYISYELPYEIIEKFLKPDYLLLGYPSAVMITSQLDSEKKYFFNYLKNNNIKNIYRKTNKLYKRLGIDLRIINFSNYLIIVMINMN